MKSNHPINVGNDPISEKVFVPSALHGSFLAAVYTAVIGTPDGTRKSDLVDEFVGSRMRERRVALGLSQEELGQAIGVTCLEVREYEIGAARVGNGQLVHIASALEVDLDFFFDGETSQVDAGRASRAEVNAEVVKGFIASADGLELIKAFVEIKDAEIRRHIVALVKRINSGR